jgi:hypothetical protein
MLVRQPAPKMQENEMLPATVTVVRHITPAEGFAAARAAAAALNAAGAVSAVANGGPTKGYDILVSPRGAETVLHYDQTDTTTRWAPANRGRCWVNAWYGDSGEVSAWDASWYFDTEAERDAALATLPKSVGARRSILTLSNSGRERHVFSIVSSANLYPNGVTGAANETGIRRYRALARHLGSAIGWAPVYANSFPTRAAMEAVLPAA